MNTMTKEHKALYHLMACALHGTVPDAATLEQADMNEVFRLAHRHMISAMAASAALKTAAPADGLVERMRFDLDAAVYRAAMMDDERTRLYAHMDGAGIRYLPLKGILMQELYPEYGMREMTDNDILFDETYREPLRAFFLENGYEEEEKSAPHHDSYHKAPFYNFEMHVALFNPKEPPALYAYYADVWDRAIPDGGGSLGCHLSPEDFYLYILAHAYKHYIITGTGLRTLADIYVCGRRLTLDRAYVDRELDTLGMRTFEKTVCELAEILFGSPDDASACERALTDEYARHLDYFMRSGMNGSADTEVERLLRRLRSGSDQPTPSLRRRYILARLFPPAGYLYAAYPFFERHRLLTPFMYLIRVGSVLTGKRRRIAAELEALRKSQSIYDTTL